MTGVFGKKRKSGLGTFWQRDPQQRFPVDENQPRQDPRTVMWRRILFH